MRFSLLVLFWSLHGTLGIPSGWTQSPNAYANLSISGAGEQHFFDSTLAAYEYIQAHYTDISGKNVAFAIDSETEEHPIYTIILTKEQYAAFMSPDACLWNEEEDGFPSTCKHVNRVESGRHVSIVLPLQSHDELFIIAFNPNNVQLNVPRFHIHVGNASAAFVSPPSILFGLFLVGIIAYCTRRHLRKKRDAVQTNTPRYIHVN